MATERLQKILAQGGVASRRAAEALITAGRVRVNGKIATELGTKADPRRDKIEVDGKRVIHETPVYVLVHKPRGVVATMSDPEGRPCMKDMLAKVEGRLYPVGRLDFATSGALLATNDGDFADGLMHPKKGVPKTYVLKVAGVMKPDDLDRWRKGIELEDGWTLPADVSFIRHEAGKTWLELTIREGRNQQIRRMGQVSGFPVMRLSRTSFAGVTTEGLRPGDWRFLTREELGFLKKTYGVPKTIPAPVEAPVAPRGRPHAAPRGRADGSAVSTRPGRGRRAAGEGMAAARPQRGRRTEEAPAPAARSDRGTRRGDAPAGPRYGGGSPGRRGNDVTQDWGGGARRGSSSGRGAADAPPPRGELGRGGRSGRTRTTGTAGGVKSEGNDTSTRLPGRRRR